MYFCTSIQQHISFQFVYSFVLKQWFVEAFNDDKDLMIHIYLMCVSSVIVSFCCSVFFVSEVWRPFVSPPVSVLVEMHTMLILWSIW